MSLPKEVQDAFNSAVPHLLIRGDSGRSPDGSCWSMHSSAHGFWLSIDAWDTIRKHLQGAGDEA